MNDSSTSNAQRIPLVLSGPRQRFAEAIATGMTGTAAYQAAYPKAKERGARSNATKLLTIASVKAEIARIRAAAAALPGSAVLTLREKRELLAGIARAGKDTDRIAAIRLDNDLAGEGSEAKAADAFAGSIGEVMARIRSRQSALGLSRRELWTTFQSRQGPPP